MHNCTLILLLLVCVVCTCTVCTIIIFIHYSVHHEKCMEESEAPAKNYCKRTRIRRSKYRSNTLYQLISNLLYLLTSSNSLSVSPSLFPFYTLSFLHYLFFLFFPSRFNQALEDLKGSMTKLIGFYSNQVDPQRKVIFISKQKRNS